MFGTAPDYHLAFNDELLEGPLDTAAECNLGMQFKQGHVGLLSQVKFFMKDINKANFKDITTFQGSDDGDSYDDLFTMDQSLHEGWNYHKWEDGD